MSLRVEMVLNRYFPMIGGAEQQAKILCKELKALNIHTRVVTSKFEQNLKEDDVVDGIDVLRLKGGKLFYLYLLIHFFKNRDKFDVIHCHSISITSFICAFAAKLQNKPSILKLTVAGEIRQIFKSRACSIKAYLKYLLIKFAVNNSFVVALTKEGESELKEFGLYKYTRIPNGVSNSLNTQVSLQKNRNVSEVTFGFLGRFCSQKGIPELLEAFSRTNNNSKLILAGSTYLQENSNIDDTIEKYSKKLAERLIILPSENPPLGFFKEITHFVSASKFEGMPNSVLEALSLNIPCILSDIGAHKEIAIENNFNGIKLFSNQTQLTDFLNESIVTKTAELLPDIFKIETVANCYKELYINLVDNS